MVYQLAAEVSTLVGALAVLKVGEWVDAMVGW
jgi:hypothetical protein